MKSIADDLSIVLGGEAGQGIQTVESILINAVKFGGYHVCSTKEYMSRVRGGENSTEIRVSSKRICAYVNRIDILIYDLVSIYLLLRIVFVPKNDLSSYRGSNDYPIKYQNILFAITMNCFSNICKYPILPKNQFHWLKHWLKHFDHEYDSS